MSSESRVLHVRVDVQTHEAVKAGAVAEGRTVSSLVAQILRKWGKRKWK